MAPVKFGLFKARSRDHQEQPSTENLLHSSNSGDFVATPSSPVASTSKANAEDCISDILQMDEIEVCQKTPTRRKSESSRVEESQINYKQLKNQASVDFTTTSTLNDIQQHSDNNTTTPDNDDNTTLACDNDDNATSYDANSIQLDELSIAPSEDLSVYCANLKRPKKSRSKEEQQLRDLDMWQASNIEVMQNLLSRTGSLDEQIKWEAIATSRGLCTLTDNCQCGDCNRGKYLAGVTDGDGGLGAAPLFNAISVGCVVQ